MNVLWCHISIAACILLSIGCNDRVMEKKVHSLDTLQGQFTSLNRVHYSVMGAGHNTIDATGFLGLGRNRNFWDSITYWGPNLFPVNERVTNFNIFVDTANRLKLSLPTFGLNEANFTIDSTYVLDHEEVADFQAFPVYVQNLDTIDHVLSREERALTMVYEAVDSTGQWKQIECWPYFYFCGNSYENLVIKPNQYLVVKVLEHGGDYHTRLRLRYRNFDWDVYSNEFYGNINYEQFNDSVPRHMARSFSRLYKVEDSVVQWVDRKFDEIMLQSTSDVPIQEPTVILNEVKRIN